MAKYNVSRVGIVSDSHDAIKMIEKAVEVLNGQDVELVIACGDYISPFTVARYAKLKCKMVGVFGNNDGDKSLLKERFSEVGFEVTEGPLVLEIGGKRAIVMHGYKNVEITRAIVESLAERGLYDIVIYGHTHAVDNRKIRNTLVLNPGEICGYLTGKSTVMVLDLEKLEAKVLEL